MLKKFFFALSINLFEFSPVAFSVCPLAIPTNDPRFCEDFQSVAACHCRESGLHPDFCADTQALVNFMISFYGTLERACKSQKVTTQADCLDNWNCYLKGGIDSRGRLCSSNQKACPKK
jgi:hypothetical protein